jgi:hypothetical protein
MRKTKLPAWTDGTGGGSDLWEAWIDRQRDRCHRRAKKWATANQPNRLLPSRKDWKQEILSAVEKSNGCGHYSRWPLRLGGPTSDWSYPSVDHCVDPGTAEVVIETRLVNDMKTIMSPKEFREMIGHLAATLKIEAHELSAWRCSRSFAGPQKVEEPALPSSKLPRKPKLARRLK